MEEEMVVFGPYTMPKSMKKELKRITLLDGKVFDVDNGKIQWHKMIRQIPPIYPKVGLTFNPRAKSGESPRKFLASN